MGAYKSLFLENVDQSVSSQTHMHPSKSDWIIVHANAANLAIVEVDRLWIRFQQLGCNEDGVLNRPIVMFCIGLRLRQTSLLKTGAVIQAAIDAQGYQINLHREPVYTQCNGFLFQSLLDHRGTMTFLTFLNAMKWAENAPAVDKLKVAFGLINNGEPVPKDLMFRVLKRTYPDDSEQNVKKITETFMRQVDDKNQGYITEAQFVKWAFRLPQSTLTSLLDFHIVPISITSDAHRIFSTNQEEANFHVRQIPSSETLERIALDIGQRDWNLVANKLGFISQEMRAIENRHQFDRIAQAEEMLKEWRAREGTRATCRELEKALDSAGMYDAVGLLNS